MVWMNRILRGTIKFVLLLLVLYGVIFFSEKAFAATETMPSSVVNVNEQSSFNNPFLSLDKARKERLKISNVLGNDQASLRSNLSSDEKKQKEKEFLGVQGNRYMVKFKEDVSMQQIFEVVNPYKYKVIGDSEHRLFILEIMDVNDFEQSSTGLIEFIEEDKEKKSHDIPSDTYYPNQWALPAINIQKAWDINKGSDSVYVAIIDSGIYRNQPDLASVNIRNGWDYIFEEFCDWDSTGHGTNVTGIIGAQTNNAKGIAGVNWNVAIVPLRVISSDGYGYTSDTIAAIYDAADLGCDVINLSLGSPDYSSTESLAVSYAISKGSIVVASAGNDGATAYNYPASYDGVISVGSVDSNLNYSSFSQYNNKVAVTAPGRNIFTTADWLNQEFGNDYAYVSGTSFSAPYVSGIAALMSACKPSITATEFKDKLKLTCTDLGNPGFDNHYGYGLINAEKMLQMVSITQVQSVSLNKNSTTLNVGNTETLTAMVYPANATNQTIFWSSNNTSIATVNNGKVTAVAPGTAVITVTTEDGNKTVNCTITVNKFVQEEKAAVDILDTVQLTINISGSGMYNLIIKDIDGTIVNEQRNLQGQPGPNDITWDGKDNNGTPLPDGKYQLTLTTVKNGQEHSIYDWTFQKQAKVINATAEINRLSGVVQSVSVHLTPTADGKVDISVKNGNVSTAILANQAIYAGQPFDYTISKDLFDFSSVDLSKVSIELIAQ
ncbi:S8 family serine peptidase [Desulfosporosinus nitroreducens]|uniref:S8 family serine peptidase n=1 Tax=Desulfosporosinus nitroreducens TaxID=2018668 RepID=A0ABT8QL85_9FIRM|nr:S8 family serine peptidase [Desulfosporosinus nitroreducens]MDO0822084.1 S8 family serine peptidase [Desulfosporosinus nitroreducens]